MWKRLLLLPWLIVGIIAGALMYVVASPATATTANHPFNPFPVGDEWNCVWISYSTLSCKGFTDDFLVRYDRDTQTYTVDPGPNPDPEKQEEADDLQEELDNNPGQVPPSPYTSNEGEGSTGFFSPWAPFFGDPFFIVPAMCTVALPVNVPMKAVARTIQVSWGDGNVTTINVPAGSGTYSQTVSHTYAGESPYGHVMQPGDWVENVHSHVRAIADDGSYTWTTVVHGVLHRYGTGSEDGG